MKSCDCRNDDRHTGRQTPAIIQSVPCYAIAME